MTRALQISLLEEENKVAKMKDLRDSLSNELEAKKEIWKLQSIIINPTACITEWEYQMNSNEESTMHANNT